MRNLYLNFLVWLAAKFNYWANKIFHHALLVTLTGDQKDREEEAKRKPILLPPPEVATAELINAHQEAEDEAAETEEKTDPKIQAPPMTPPPTSVTEPFPAMPTFTGADNKPIPPSFDELPSMEVFKAMFERKYGRGGHCPMTIGGQPKLFTCETLYELLKQIRTKDDVSPMHMAVYGTVMAVILHGHGETLDPKMLN